MLQAFYQNLLVQSVKQPNTPTGETKGTKSPFLGNLSTVSVRRECIVLTVALQAGISEQLRQHTASPHFLHRAPVKRDTELFHYE